MKPWLFRLVATALIVAAVIWSWKTFFPSTEKLIRQRITQAAKLSSFSPSEDNPTRLANVNVLMSYFTPDVECFIDMPDIGDWTVKGRSQLRDAVLSASDNLESMRVKLLDLVVAVAPDKQNATVELTARASLPGDNDFIVHEMKFTLRKVDKDWLIACIETVKTLQ